MIQDFPFCNAMYVLVVVRRAAQGKTHFTLARICPKNEGERRVYQQQQQRVMKRNTASKVSEYTQGVDGV